MGSKRNKRRKNKNNDYEDDIRDIDPRKGIRKLNRRKNRHREKLDCKNIYHPDDWSENMEDYYDRR
jgi:hypothetical protein